MFENFNLYIFKWFVHLKFVCENLFKVKAVYIFFSYPLPSSKMQPYFTFFQFSSVQSLSCVWLFATPRTPGFLVHHQLLELTQTHVHRGSDAIHHLILCHPLFLLPSIIPSVRVFSNESILRIRWSKYWSFSFNISPSNGHPGLISFSIDWLDLLAVQGDSQESSPTPQFKSISSSVLSFFYGPALTSIHDYGNQLYFN